MIIKCKMCGGDIEFVPGATYGTCEYCGSTCTIPQADDEQKLNRYNRANHFRRQCEFDKALAAYEKILEQDDTDAEAHWGAALSRYGIEYVEDPATKKRIPTCHRLQVASILADADYLAAVENAPDAESRRLYEEQAAQIAEIQKGILAISANEKPYDVFICYKETDDNGQRTRDSQWAQDVYYGLTDAGYKVFFSRITLEDKLGQQYEPYIFAALNSARVMAVIGSKPEYFNAVWVKNEWSRYLALMANDRTRLLIPCYRDMDPYDLPEELSALQSQDMSKIGFMQDLIRGIKKVLGTDKVAAQAKTMQQAVPTGNTGVLSPLLRRGFMFLEDGEFDQADQCFENLLSTEPENASGYIGKLLVDLHLQKISDLEQHDRFIMFNNNYKRAIQFGSDSQKEELENFVQAFFVRRALEKFESQLCSAKESRDKIRSELSQLKSQAQNLKESKTNIKGLFVKTRLKNIQSELDATSFRITELTSSLETQCEDVKKAEAIITVLKGNPYSPESKAITEKYFKEAEQYTHSSNNTSNNERLFLLNMNIGAYKKRLPPNQYDIQSIANYYMDTIRSDLGYRYTEKEKEELADFAKGFFKGVIEGTSRSLVDMMFESPNNLLNMFNALYDEFKKYYDNKSR